MKILALVPLALAAVACATTPAQPTAEDQAALAEELRGRTAGDPQSCVRQLDLGGNRSVGESIIIFEARGDRLYVNRPSYGCPVIDRSRILVTRNTTGQLCRGDVIDIVERDVGTVGSCALGDFTPYSRRDD